MDQENSDRKREGGNERTQLHVFTHIYVHLALVPFYMKLQIFIIYMYLELNVVRQRNRFFNGNDRKLIVKFKFWQVLEDTVRLRQDGSIYDFLHCKKGKNTYRSVLLLYILNFGLLQ